MKTRTLRQYELRIDDIPVCSVVARSAYRALRRFVDAGYAMAVIRTATIRVTHTVEVAQ